MRILHTSDWHLGIQLHGVSLLEEQRSILSEMITLIKTRSIDAVALAGDVFDSAVVSGEAVRLYSECMEAICLGCGAKVLLCAGNHDGAARLSACGGLLRGSGLYVAGRLSDGMEPVVVGDTAFFLVPYFHTDEARYLFPEETLANTSRAMEHICRELREKRIPGLRSILVGHCFVLGGEPGDSDRTAMLGGAGNIDAAVFEGFDYVALGHLHRAQTIRARPPDGMEKGVTVRYSGTPYPYSFQEAGQEKSVTILDTETMEWEAVPLKAGRPLRVLRGAYERILELAPWDARKEDFIKAELTDRPAGLECLASLREFYPNLLKLEGIMPAGTAEGEALSPGDLEALRPRELVRRFGKEIGGVELDEGLLDLFEELSREGEQEEVRAQ